MIIVWGVDHGKCAPYSGHGFRQVFDNKDDVDHYIKLQCNKIPREDLAQYAVYITNEYRDIDEVMHYHNWKDSDLHYREGNDKIEEIDVEEIKNHIDILYQAYMKKEAAAKAKIEYEVNNMSSDERMRQQQLFKEAGLFND